MHEHFCMEKAVCKLIITVSSFSLTSFHANSQSSGKQIKYNTYIPAQQQVSLLTI